MKKRILHELKEHSPFTALATLIAVIIVLTGILISKPIFISLTRDLFDFFHPAHILFSSAVSTAIFYKYRKKFLQALAVGIFISILAGSVSDIMLPYSGGFIFSIPISFHLPIIETPLLIISISFLGALAGAIMNKTKFPHLIHVSLSVFASLFYLISFGIFTGIFPFFLIFTIVFISVVIPCCLSDIVFPLMVQKKLLSPSKK